MTSAKKKVLVASSFMVSFILFSTVILGCFEEEEETEPLVRLVCNEIEYSDTSVTFGIEAEDPDGCIDNARFIVDLDGDRKSDFDGLGKDLDGLNGIYSIKYIYRTWGLFTPSVRVIDEDGLESKTVSIINIIQPSLELKAELNKDVYRVGDDIFLKLKLRNLGTRWINVSEMDFNLRSLSDSTIITPDDRVLEHIKVLDRDPLDVSIQPGASYARTINLLNCYLGDRDSPESGRI